MESCLGMLMKGSSTPTLPQPCSEFTQPASSWKSPIKTKKDIGHFLAGLGTQPDVALKGEITSNGEMDIIPSLTWLSSFHKHSHSDTPTDRVSDKAKP